MRTRDLIAFVGLIVSIAAFVQPEIRRCIGLDPGGCPVEEFRSFTPPRGISSEPYDNRLRLRESLPQSTELEATQRDSSSTSDRASRLEPPVPPPPPPEALPPRKIVVPFFSEPLTVEPSRSSEVDPSRATLANSGVGGNYSKLQQLLVSGNFKQADQETRKIMLQVANRQQQGWLNDASIQEFPCQDLRAIDQLWVQYSNSKFGLSVQKRIFQEVGKDQDKFGESVGWSSKILGIQPPPGHLPVADVCWPGKVSCWFWVPRLDACGI